MTFEPLPGGYVHLMRQSRLRFYEASRSKRTEFAPKRRVAWGGCKATRMRRPTLTDGEWWARWAT